MKLANSQIMLRTNFIIKEKKTEKMVAMSSRPCKMPNNIYESTLFFSLQKLILIYEQLTEVITTNVGHVAIDPIYLL